MEIYSFDQPQLRPNAQARKVRPLFKSGSKKSGAKSRAAAEKADYTPMFNIPSYAGTYAESLAQSQSPCALAPELALPRGFLRALGGVADALLSHLAQTVLVAAVALLSAALAYGGVLAADYLSELLLEPLSFEALFDTDSELVDGAMRSFVFAEAEDSAIDDEGNILSAVAKGESSYTEPVTFTSYVVKANDSVSAISQKFGLTNISTVIALNDITSARRLQKGKTLTIPSIDGMYYTVAGGDTLDSVSAKYALSVEKLVDVNDLDSSELQVGQKLFIPGAKLSGTELKKVLGELFIYPLAGGWYLSSDYGMRTDPISGAKRSHTGIDMAAPAQTPIMASCDGTVVLNEWSNVYGNYVVIKHADGYQTLYAHMLKSLVKTGQVVKQGEKIGLVGSTGYSTGAHLHFSVYKNQKLINPREVLK